MFDRFNLTVTVTSNSIDTERPRNVWSVFTLLHDQSNQSILSTEAEYKQPA